MRFSWQNYRRYAMGKNELRPLTKDGFEGSMFGELTQTTGRQAQLLSGLSLSGLSQASLDSEDSGASVSFLFASSLPHSGAWEGEHGEGQGAWKTGKVASAPETVNMCLKRPGWAAFR